MAGVPPRTSADALYVELNTLRLWKLYVYDMGMFLYITTTIRKSKDYVYDMWVYKVLGIWKGY